MTSTTELLRRTDGAPDLLVRRWVSAGEPWADVLIVHGLAEHSGRYERTGATLAAAGLAVEALDLRGAGGSGGRRAHVERWSDYLDDVESRIRAVRASAGGRPVVLLGHSLGGLIALDYATSSRQPPELLILSAPAVASTIPGWTKALAGVLSRISPTLRLANALSGDQLSRDPAVGEAYFADPLVETHSTVRLGAEGFGAQTRVSTSGHTLAIPALVTHGGADPIVPTASSAWLEDLPGVVRIVYPDLRHETLNEPEGPAVVADMIAWLREQVAAGAGARTRVGGGSGAPSAGAV
jgi:alpha-beta hydrolase superfamily lysophospholipase